MAKTITINFEGTEYTLEFTRKSIETMEKQGFVVGDIAEKPMSTLPVLFAGAFLAHHRFVKKDIVDKIFAKLTNKQEFIQKLAEMYSEPLEAMMDEPEESEGNLTWGASW
ncbi:MAG: DUF5055 domain-containing protein [Oscillospiraceae bacterium]|nr:DUF5055 domain-containing protein [Oscillospiraceae bacterium]